MKFYRSCTSLGIVVCLLGQTSAHGAAVPEEAVNRAVERGVAALRKGQGADGQFAPGTYGSGPTSLATLALLECGVAAQDEQVRKAVAVVRDDCPTMNRTYNLALAIMMFDRLGDPLDVPLIHVLGVRLLEGQKNVGGWTYSGPDVSAEEAERVRALVQRRAELKTQPGEGGPTKPPEIDPGLLERVRKVERYGPGRPDPTVDNSNTQFAVLGTWVARRNGVPADFALKRADGYFRATHVRGVWPYSPPGESSGQPANTCSGLLGIAVAAGVIRDAQMRTTPDGKDRKDGKPAVGHDPLKDQLVQAAMNYVGSQVAELAATGLSGPGNGYRDLYFLWSVERVGMVYSVAAMGRVDWYQVGASLILRDQHPDGAWGSHTASGPGYAAEINTSFALLFLKRSNFAADLTANLRRKQNQTSMKSGGDKGEQPPAIEPSAAQKLAAELASAAPARQEAILGELRDGKGNEFTEALARVIPKLVADVQQKARDALAERLARMTAATVRTKLKDPDAEVRRASALACSMKDDKGFIPDLIAALEDADAWVVRAAGVSLRTLTGQNFGPPANATAAERAKAVAAWKAWWKQQSAR